jgi:hypothetical protein
MIIWLDAQLSPATAPWISRDFSVSAVAVCDLGLRNAKDSEIFFAARQANAIVDPFLGNVNAKGPQDSFGNHNWPICGTLFWPTLSN